MKIVRIENNIVVEIIPEYATPVSKWYNSAFANQCVEAPDEVQTNWYYNSATNTFSEERPEPTPEPEQQATTEEILNTLLGVTDDE